KGDEALPLLEGALSAQGEASDEDRYHKAIIREKLAEIELDKGRYEDALSNSNLATAVYEAQLPELHPHRVETLKVAALANLALHREKAAKPLVDNALEIARRQLDAASIAQSERQQLALNFRLREILDLELSLPAELVSPAAAYQHVLQWKGAVQ